MTKIFIPGNLLISGEYAVTLEGGKGIAVAVLPCATIESQDSPMFSVHSSFNQNCYTWKEDAAAVTDMPLINIVFKTVKEHLLKKQIPPPPPLRISIDTSSFYYPSGRKKGFGSSAAVSAGLTYLLLASAYETSPQKEEVFLLALEAHREFQGGKGSGYDIAASLFGGTGLFIGGKRPNWTPLTLDWVESLVLISGDEAASTKGALNLFNTARERAPGFEKQFFKWSNEVTDHLAGASNLAFAKEKFARAWELNVWIHEKLGICGEGKKLKEILEKYRMASCPAKALGAGGELAAALCPLDQSFAKDASFPLIVSKGGLRCEL